MILKFKSSSFNSLLRFYFKQIGCHPILTSVLISFLNATYLPAKQLQNQCLLSFPLMAFLSFKDTAIPHSSHTLTLHCLSYITKSKYLGGVTVTQKEKIRNNYCSSFSPFSLVCFVLFFLHRHILKKGNTWTY